MQVMWCWRVISKICEIHKKSPISLLLLRTLCSCPRPVFRMGNLFHLFYLAFLFICLFLVHYFLFLYNLNVNPLSEYNWQQLSPTLWVFSSPSWLFVSLVVLKLFSFMTSIQFLTVILGQIESYLRCPLPFISSYITLSFSDIPCFLF